MNILFNKNDSNQRMSRISVLWRRVIYRYTAIILLFGTPSLAFSETPYCNEIFFNGLITHGEGSQIQFERNAQLLGSNQHYLPAAKITSDYYSPKRSCDALFCRASDGTLIEPLSIAQKDTFSTHDVIVYAHQKKILGNKNAAFGRVDVAPGATLGFKPRTNAYTIDELNLGYKSKLQLPAGEYWVGNLNLEAAGKIEVIGEGTAVLYVINDLSIPANFKTNDNTKDPAHLAIYTFGDLNLAADSKTRAFIHTIGNTRLEQKAKISGALMAKNIYLTAGSKVNFTPEALHNFQFGNFCTGAYPVRDLTAPIIELDPFPYNTLASSVTISGKITEPDNGVRWLTGATLVVYPDYIPIALESDGRFTIEVPLTSELNAFTIFAWDRADNDAAVQFTIRRETNIEFAIKMDYYEWQQFKPMPVSGVITIPEGRTIASAFITTPQGNIPLQLVNNRFSLYLPFVRGYNEYQIVARDQDGNEISEMVYIDGLSVAVLHKVQIEPIAGGPTHKVTGFIYSLWPIEDLSLAIEGIPQELKPVSDGLYEFAAETDFYFGRNRVDITITTPEETTYEEFDEFYYQDIIYLSVEEVITNTPDDKPATVTLNGYLHIPLELIRKNLTLTMISDRFPGIEYPVTLTGPDGRPGWFSIEIPLLPGQNTLSAKVRQGNKDVEDVSGSTEIEVILN
ncbi:MAG: Thrombospondin type 3 repeat family [Cellvibrio sp.]|nr:Thrombospondin type 3 repeat family [Cellvibrio sp.]